MGLLYMNDNIYLINSGKGMQHQGENPIVKLTSKLYGKSADIFYRVISGDVSSYYVQNIGASTYYKIFF